MDANAMRDLIEELIPFNRFLGMRCAEIRPSFARLELPFREDFIGDPLRRALHGGLLSTLADTTGGMAVWSELRDARSRLSTIDLRVDYLRPGKPELVACEATVVRQGNRVGVTDMRLFHPSSPEETIATGKGVYNITIVKS
ncbi:hotdog fold thioesterase [Pendulispora rubella]|uniref:Hotdog fold thioesterase n=1 Tax=Pendulispora rubella TaxID=2741070 RepID=A0ABZ2L4Q2_9BACT